MLLSLHVKNMALIRELEMEFGSGLNILTGETGAGKSILIGSINVALGMQNFKGFAREDADSALVELVFSAEEPRVQEKLKEMELSAEDGQIILTRKLSGTRSISKINGETVPVSSIRELALSLIDIYGQHEHQSLLYQKNHLKILDEFAKEELEPFKAEGKALYAEYTKIEKLLASCETDESQRKKEADFLQYEINEIDAAALTIGEDEELETKYKKMSNARKIASDASEAYDLTSAGNDCAADAVSKALQRLLSVSDYDPDLSNLADQLSEIENLLGDFNRELSAYLDDLTFDEEEFSAMAERLDEINRLKSKYGNSIEEILNDREKKEKRLQELLNYDEYHAQLVQDFEKARQRLTKNAKAMSEIRSRYAKQLEGKIQEQLKDLNFLDTVFEIAVAQDAPLGADGFDTVCFLMSINPGSPKKPLADVASGGELSRIMLALKTVLAKKDDMPTLIFDEIDVGISGRTAQKVSEKMAAIAADHQVLCITHLAQIASMADHHFLIEKAVEDGETHTGIRELQPAESIDELARILGGAQITDLTRQSAKEMKEMAEHQKSAQSPKKGA